MRESYCHCCHWSRPLPDGVYCAWCLKFFYANRRLPVPGDREPTAIEQLYAQLDAM